MQSAVLEKLRPAPSSRTYFATSIRAVMSRVMCCIVGRHGVIAVGRGREVYSLLMRGHAKTIIQLDASHTVAQPRICESMYVCMYVKGKKVKFSHTRYRALGPELIPVYRQSARR